MLDEPNDLDVDALDQLGQCLIQAILDGETLDRIKALIDAGAPVWYQAEDDGMSSLHAAAYSERKDLVDFLITEGAVWNAVDWFQNTAADIALSLNNDEIYYAIRNAGVRAELLLALLSSRSSSLESSTNLLFKVTDSTAVGSTDAYLSSHLQFMTDARGQDICMLDVGDEQVGVMMGWETSIMHETVDKLCHGHKNVGQGLRILNVGFGLGIIDNLFQSLPTLPTRHVIIEPHRDVLNRMKELGWYEKAGVTILEGKWQDFVASDELTRLGGFDVVYTDTFSESYDDLRQFFRDLPSLLADEESRFGFFNGLGATNALFYDVYSHLSEIHLGEVGIKIEWSDVDVPEYGEDVWNHTRKYFNLPLYRLPVGRMTAACRTRHDNALLHA